MIRIDRQSMEMTFTVEGTISAKAMQMYVRIDLIAEKLDHRNHQGQQHFYPVEAWGGKSALRDLQDRDERKRKLCKQHDKKLIEIEYTEPLSEKNIANRIKTHTIAKSF